MLIECLYFMAVGLTIEDKDGFFFGTSWLLAKPAFLFAGITAGVAFLRPYSKLIIVSFLFGMAGACFGRMFTLVLSDTTDFSEKVRALGWVIPWLLAVVSIIQINLARVIRKTKLWNG